MHSISISSSMESGLELESSLVFPPMMVKNGMESSMEMESSPGFPPMRSSPVLSKGTVMSPAMMSPVNRSWGQTSWRRWSPVFLWGSHSRWSSAIQWSPVLNRGNNLASIPN